MEVRSVHKLDSNTTKDMDSLGQVLNDDRVPQPQDWWKTQADWQYEAELAVAVEDDMIEIHGEYSKDLNVFFTVDDIKSLFDFSQLYYKEFCAISHRYVLSYETEGENGLQ